jgi:cellulose synthase/poly-beta-1,6-N-acetylglucosamine synthase-like glycosyltransferase
MEAYLAMFTPLDIAIHALMFVSLYFEVFLLLTFLEKRPDKALAPRTPSRFPSVLVTVPCFNAGMKLDRTIRSLMALSYPKDKLSVLIVDDGSTDNSFAIMESLQREFPSLQLYQAPENAGKHAALNYGIGHSTAELIGCLDADTFVAPDALEAIVAVFESTGAHAVIPAIKVHEPGTILARMQRAEYMLSIFVRKIFTFLDSNFVTPGPFSFFRREVFDQIGVYQHAHNTEDMEMAMRMQVHNLKIANAEHAHVYTIVPSKLRDLIRQRVRWTYGFLRNFVDYRSKLVFRPQYGTIAMFILPVAFFSIFSALTLTTIALGSSIAAAAEHYDRIRTVGFSTPSLTLDWFFMNTSSMVILMVVIISITLFLMSVGRALSGERLAPTTDMAIYVLLYGLVAPLWLAKAVYSAALARPVSWSAEISRRRD